MISVHYGNTAFWNLFVVDSTLQYLTKYLTRTVDFYKVFILSLTTATTKERPIFNVHSYMYSF